MSLTACHTVYQRISPSSHVSANSGRVSGRQSQKIEPPANPDITRITSIAPPQPTIPAFRPLPAPLHLFASHNFRLLFEQDYPAGQKPQFQRGEIISIKMAPPQSAKSFRSLLGMEDSKPTPQGEDAVSFRSRSMSLRLLILMLHPMNLGISFALSCTQGKYSLALDAPK